MNRLRKVVFPHGWRLAKDDVGLYPRMKKILREAKEGPKVLAEAKTDSLALTTLLYRRELCPKICILGPIEALQSCKY